MAACAARPPDGRPPPVCLAPGKTGTVRPRTKRPTRPPGRPSLRPSPSADGTDAVVGGGPVSGGRGVAGVASRPLVSVRPATGPAVAACPPVTAARPSRLRPRPPGTGRRLPTASRRRTRQVKRASRPRGLALGRVLTRPAPLATRRVTCPTGLRRGLVFGMSDGGVFSRPSGCVSCPSCRVARPSRPLPSGRPKTAAGPTPRL